MYSSSSPSIPLLLDKLFYQYRVVRDGEIFTNLGRMDIPTTYYSHIGFTDYGDFAPLALDFKVVSHPGVFLNLV